MSYQVQVSISVTPGKLYLISGGPASGTDIYYNNKKIFGSGVSNYFVATETSYLIVQSTTSTLQNITVQEYVRSYYDMNDGQGGTLAFQPVINKWVSMYSYVAETISMVSNRLVSFKNGNIYIHNSTAFNTWYGQSYDSIIAFPHNEGGNTIKSYDSIAIEGDSPDKVHMRTETPYIQSSDLVTSDFANLEGVYYSAIYRDRLSPNTGSSDVYVNLYKGDKVKGEVLKMMITYTQPTSLKQLKFVNVNYSRSRGQSV